jgi:prepilin-type N-terminal cleavage/methylation domain-containing protein
MMDKRRSGFTIIELIVVLALTAIFSTFAILYSSTSRNEVALSVESQKIGQLILEAKSLSIATYKSPGSASCGYGFVLNLNTNPQTYSIFSYSPAGAPPCASDYSLGTTGINAPVEEIAYTGGTWQIPVSQGVKIVGGTDPLAMVLFYPPNPDIFLSEDNATFDVPPKTLHIYLTTIDGKNNATISVSPGGQVTFQ